MRFGFDDETRALRDAAARFLGERSASRDVREAMATDAGHDPAVWQEMAAELGWAALTVGERWGGLGLGHVATVALMELMGQSLLCSPWFATVCLGARAIEEAGDDGQRERWLPAIAMGETTATLCADGPGFEETGDGWVLRGESPFVVDGHTADLLVVAATGRGETALFVVERSAPGVVAERLHTMDETRRSARVRFDDIAVAPDARLARGDAASLERTLDYARIALSAELTGVAERCLELSVEYAQTRVQFGRPIGSFQAVKHKCAEMLVAVETARDAAYYAGWVADHEPDDLRKAASMAKAWCSDAAWRCAAEAVQIHGGIGFTWESDVHLYFKRARAAAALLGGAEVHRQRYADALEL